MGLRILSLCLVCLLYAMVKGNDPPVVETIPAYFIYQFSEATPINTSLFTIKATDQNLNNLTIKEKDTYTVNQVYLNINSSKPGVMKMDVFLKKKFDCDYLEPLQYMYFEIDDHQHGGKVVQKVDIFIKDVNDEKPDFANRPYRAVVKENMKVNTVLTSLTILANDPDNGPGGSVYYSLEAAGQSSKTNGVFEIDQNDGKLTLKKKLDYDIQNFYQYKVVAEDGGGLNSTADLWITISDTQNKPPNFVSSSLISHIPENTSMGTTVMTLTAKDGDRGVPNRITYNLSNTDCPQFQINSATGVISLNNPLDRDTGTLKDHGGVCSLNVTAMEVNETLPQNGRMDASIVVTIVVDDVNDNDPTFNQSVYNAIVSEDAPSNNPVTFQGVASITITDKDQVSYSKFKIEVMKDNKVFEGLTASPSHGLSVASVMLLVKNNSFFDYETHHSITVQVRATDEESKKSSNTTVTINITNVNEFTPVFTKHENNITIPENTSVGTKIGKKFKATDQDEGEFGKITYSLRNQDKFSINNNGTITVEKKLDREENNLFNLTLEATDGGQKMASTTYIIHISDVNDEKPTFKMPSYSGLMKENEDHFFYPLRLIVNATDKDEPNTKNSMVKYEIFNATNNLNHNFTINNTTGEIKPVSIDYERLDPKLNGTIRLYIVAHDLGTPRKESGVEVHVTVYDENDNSPVFNQSFYKAKIFENASVSTVVLTVIATDGDGTEINRNLSYRIQSGSQDKFRINANNGNISINSELNRELQDMYNLTVVAIDYGTPSNTGTTKVFITVKDVNDVSPVFNNAKQTVNVFENKSRLSHVETVTATDEDIDHQLLYSIVSVIASNEANHAVNVTSTNVTNYFAIFSNNGTVYVNAQLDRETAEKIVLKIMVNDTKAVNRHQTATTFLTINLEDVNDCHPVFGENPYKENISENALRNSQVLQVSATDADKSQTITYQVQDTKDRFTIKQNGIIFLKKELDREEQSQINFTVVAVDSGSPSLNSTTTVLITVLDFNDNSPQFNFHNATYQVLENATVGTIVTVVNASDKDEGINAKIVYSIRSVSQAQVPFAINNATGEISISSGLDRENNSHYTLQITAKDSPFNKKYIKVNTTQLKIKIKDVNDNTPSFGKTIYFKEVLEDTPVGKSLFHITANDPDEGRNAKINYSISADVVYFKIDPLDGDVILNNSLLNKVGIYNITLIAIDNGLNQLKSMTQVVINVTDVNNNVPVFTVKDDTTIPVREDVCKGELIYTANATDKDHGENQKIKYMLGNRSDVTYFTIDSSTGEIHLKKQLDAQKQKRYQIVLHAEDHGKPPQKAQPVTLNINAIDVNDKPPAFSRRDYPGLHLELEVEEGKTGHLVTVEANDPDETSGICYSLSNLGEASYFNITQNNSKADLFVFSNKIDYETTKILTFYIVAEDCGNQLYNVCDNATGPHFLKSNLNVSINVKDGNDNPPIFTQKEISLALLYDVQFGTVFHNLKDDVTDLDTPKNSVHSFYLNGDFTASPELKSKLTKDQNRHLCRVNRNGTLQTSMVFQADFSGYFTARVLVNDSDGFNDTAVVMVYIIGQKQRLKIIFRQKPEQVRKFQTEFLKNLGKILKYKIISSKLETHINENNQPEPDKTDMYIFAIDKNVTVPAERLNRELDLSAQALTSIYNKYNVLKTFTTVEKEAVNSSKTKKDEVVLIAVVSLLAVFLVVIILLFFSSTRRYKRKLKAANINVFSAAQVPDMERYVVPGSNQHAIEKSNPVFNEDFEKAYNLPEKTSLDSLDVNEVGNVFSPYSEIFDEQEVAMDFIEDQQGLIPPQDMSAAYLQQVIQEREAEMNEKNRRMSEDNFNKDDDNNFSYMDGSVELETTEV